MIQNGFFGLTIIPAAKSLKVVVGINAMVEGALLSSEALSLLGLCEHVRHATAMGVRLYLLWKCLPGESAPDRVMSLSKPAKERALKFRDIVQKSCGSPITQVFDATKLPPSAPTYAISSDAALEPPEEEGLGGFVYGLFWRLVIDDLIIPVREGLAAGVNLVVFYYHIGAPTTGSPYFWLEWECDALASALIAVFDSAKAEVMYFLWEAIKETDAFKFLQPSLIMRHVNGATNVAGDLASRGKLIDLRNLSQALGLRLSEITLPPPALHLIATVRALILQPTWRKRNNILSLQKKCFFQLVRQII